jgi:MFS family permease
MTTLDVVACLQLVIILLLIEPQRRRRATLGGIIGTGAICAAVYAAIYYLGPPLVGTLYETISSFKEEYGWSGLFVTTSIVVIVVVMVFASRVDLRQNRAIRAGSKEAFDKRVNDLMRDLHYSLEDATAAAIRIRDEKKK